MKSTALPFVIILTALITVAACNSSEDKKTGETDTPTAGSDDKPATTDDQKGIGKFTDVKLTTPLDQSMVSSGKSLYDLKCASCHKLTDEKLVGPGWKDVTTRRKPEWIMNFVTNTDEMLSKDTASKAMLEVCLTRMPNQNLSDDDARHILEFMRSNDGVK
ncbi:MAG TPA: cytochrome c [Chitinophagaceae bacterium]|jgi:cytochrome c551/c552|nr:cytochrome c [Chitinophagaceae bacterium]